MKCNIKNSSSSGRKCRKCGFNMKRKGRVWTCTKCRNTEVEPKSIKSYRREFYE